MAAPDFYFANNAMFRYLHERYGKETLVDYWKEIGSTYYRQRNEKWREGGAEAVAADWRAYFDREPLSDVAVSQQENEVLLDVKVCPAIRHLREYGREIVPYYCEHCDVICGAMAESAGFAFERTGGMGSCRQRFVKVRVEARS